MKTLLKLEDGVSRHSAFDRVLGYGRKYPDAFKHTHFDEVV